MTILTCSCDTLRRTVQRNADNSALFENQDIYMRLDRNIAELIETVSGKIGLNNVLFFLTSTGYSGPSTVPQQPYP